MDLLQSLTQIPQQTIISEKCFQYLLAELEEMGMKLK